MARGYEIILSDPALPEDRVIRVVSQRKDALRIVRQLNEDLIARLGMPTPGHPLPLYFCCSAQSKHNNV